LTTTKAPHITSQPAFPAASSSTSHLAPYRAPRTSSPSEPPSPAAAASPRTVPFEPRAPPLPLPLLPAQSQNLESALPPTAVQSLGGSLRPPDPPPANLSPEPHRPHTSRPKAPAQSRKRPERRIGRAMMRRSTYRSSGGTRGLWCPWKHRSR
jgi:hypothetical protein